MTFQFISSRYPQNPGCYLMKDARGKIIYVGKAKNLRRRLGQYFQTTRQVGRIAALVQQIQEIDVILVSTELESLILENNLIKRYKPRFNILLVPDYSGYGYVVQTAELFPRLVLYKKHRVNPTLGRAHPAQIEKRFGPYLSRKISETIMKCVSEMCGIRTCDPMPHRVCFLFHLKRCLGPCERYVTLDEYLEAVERAGVYLAAPHLHLVNHLTEQMKQAAEALEFERARHIRDQIETLKTVFERQVVERDVKHDQEVVYALDRHVLILHLVRGTLVGLDWLPDRIRTEDLGNFLIEHYQFRPPAEIIVPELPDSAAVEEALTPPGAHRVKITIPVRGASKDLLEIARLNCEYRVNGAGGQEEEANPVTRPGEE